MKDHAARSMKNDKLLGVILPGVILTLFTLVRTPTLRSERE